MFDQRSDGAAIFRKNTVKFIGKREREDAIAKLEKEMQKAAKMLEFEYAAVLRDRIIELRGEKD